MIEKDELDFSLALHIAKNPWGYSEQEYREAVLAVCDFAQQFRVAYFNMKAFATWNGIDVSPAAKEGLERSCW